MSELTPKQDQFITEFLLDSNGTQAAIRAGYSPRTARSQAARLLAKANVQDALAARRAAVTQPILDRYAITRDRTLREMALLSYSNMADYVGEDGELRPIGELTRDQAAAISEYTTTDVIVTRGEHSTVVSRRTKLKLSGKREALESLAKLSGQFKDGEEETSHVTFIVNFAPRRQSRRLSYVDQERET